jgi:hypothetical protein
MRTLSGSVVPFSLACLLACGGGAAPAAGPSAPEPAAPSPSAGGASPSVDAGAPTTTLAVTDAGDTQGSKLAETHSSPPAAASAGQPSKPPHSHEVGRSPQDIRAIIQARRDEARACYDGALADHPGIEGDLVIQWTIDPKGNVTQVSLDSSRSQIVEPTVVACISDIIKKVQFAASQGGYETRAFYPFNFHPHHGGAKPAAQ